MEGEKNLKKWILITIAIIGFVGMITFLVLYVNERANNNIITETSEETQDVTDQSSELVHEISVKVDGDELFLWPTEYTVRYGNNSYGPIYNISLPGSPFNSQWFYKTTDENILGIRHTPDTFTGLDERIFIKPEEQTAVHLDGYAFILESQVTFYSPTFMNDWPIGYKISIDLEDEVCTSIPENILLLERTEDNPNPIQQWIDDCNASYPLYVSQILVNDQMAFDLPWQKVIRVPGAFDGQITYNAATQDGVAMHNGKVGFALRGVSPELDRAYFVFLDEIYSINHDGTVEHYERVDEMVRMTTELHE